MTRFYSLLTCLLVVLGRGFAADILPPMLDDDVCVPNGGIYRFFPKAGWQGGINKRITKVYEESPYQRFSAMRYWRGGWNALEGGKDEWRFDQTVEPLLQLCLAERARIILGLCWMCGGGLRGNTNVVWKADDGNWCAVPRYLYDELKASDHPLKFDASFGGGLTPDYDSPILQDRFRALLLAFAQWIEKPVTGTQVRRKDLIYGIELRYFGYWGEGAVKGGTYPVSEGFDRFIDAYLEAFPDILLIAPAQEALHLPLEKAYLKNPSNPQALRAMKHVGRMFHARNQAGPVGFFIDCWEPRTHLPTDTRVMFTPEGAVEKLGDCRLNHLWGNAYVTGEFAYFIRKYNKNDLPYATLGEQFRERHVSGLSVHNFTIIDTTQGPADPSLGNRPRTNVRPSDEICANTRRALSTLGYRIVLGSPKVARDEQGTAVSFTLTNIGTSKMYHDYYRVRVFAEDVAGRILESIDVPFDLRTLQPGEKPLVWDESRGTTVRANLKTRQGRVRLVFADAKGIEHPMCLSNRGRRASDGSYGLE